MTEHRKLQWNNDEIADHLKSAMDTLTPDVYDRIDLQTPQEHHRDRSKAIAFRQRVRTVGAVMAACLCVAVFGGGVSAFQNSRVDSFVGIDVNPSVELSVNRNNKVLKAEALNEDAAEILTDMNLKNVDLNIAVNAVIGSMVRHGYLEGIDNAILVTVSSDDKDKAALLRQNVVGDIESSLEEHKLQAVVYDQQASVTKKVKSIADEYKISYGKAYFLQELVDENDLSDEDLKLFAGMTMEEISREIADRSYNVRKDEPVITESSSSESEETTKKVTTAAESATTQSQTDTSGQPAPESTTNGTTAPPTTPAVTTPPASTAAPTESREEESTGSGKRAKIDDWDYDAGKLNIVFQDKVKWKNPTVSVKDENGESYSAKFTDTSSDSCEIEIEGLPGGINCIVTLGGVASKDGGSYMSVKGYFDTPDIADDITEGSDEETTAPTAPTAPTTAPSEAATLPAVTVPDTAAPPSESAVLLSASPQMPL